MSTASRLKPKRQCPVVGCKNTCPGGAILCADHWTLVPKDLQRAVWDEVYKSQKLKNTTPGFAAARRQAIQIATGVYSPYKE